MLKLRDRSSPERPAFSFETSPPPSEDAPGPFPRPPGEFLPERDMHMYGAQPVDGEQFEPGRSLVRCPRCTRTVLEWASADHKRICSHVLDGTPLLAKKVKGDKRVDGKKRRASEGESDASPSKLKRQRLLEDIDDEDLTSVKGLKKSEIKKLLKERERLRKRAAKEQERAAIAERKRQRALNPLDYDRQCGVINDKGLPCSRSLTCKTHTVGAKRAVQGRTRPYDELYIEWQRTHNPNFKEPAPKKEGNKMALKVASAAAQKKRRAMLDEDGLRFDEDGAREMEELIRATKICGDRVRNVSSALGNGFSLPSTPAPAKGPAAATAAAAAAPTPPRPRPVQTPFVSVWRTTTYEQLNMGDLLTKALAARPRPQPAMPNARIGLAKPGPVVSSLVPPPPAQQGVTA